MSALAVVSSSAAGGHSCCDSCVSGMTVIVLGSVLDFVLPTLDIFF